MYTREYKSDFLAKWVCASDKFLEKFNRPKPREFPNARYIWGRRYTRTHFRRIFFVEDNVKTAICRFLCDNACDIYINGSPVSIEKRDSGVVDVGEFLVNGENLLMIRAYQTASPDSFTSALTGGLRIEYENSKAVDILTDEGFENVRFIDFWETDEPAGWELDKTSNKEVRNQLIVTDMHAIAIKRSCYFRKDFTVNGRVKKAELCASALGCYEAHINGSVIDEVYFCPSAMDSTKEYQIYDVTEKLNNGENTLSAITGNGWYNCESWGALLAQKPALIMELSIEYDDGRIEKICTDGSWRVVESPLVDNDIQFGERYNALLDREGWDKCGCDVSDWSYADELVAAPFTSLLKQTYPPIRATRYLPISQVRRIGEKSYLYDCGLNIAGAVELTVRGAVRGQQIRISVSERLDENGDLELGAYVAPYYPEDSRPDGKAPCNLRNINVYVASGKEVEEYSPRFCYTGFRYIQIDGIDIDTADIRVREMHSDLALTGEFESDDETLNRLWSAVKQTWFNNCYNGPTDCPTREKNFWTGDTMIFSHLACWISDCEDFLSRWTDLGRKMNGPYGWEDEAYMLPWILYRFYGDREILSIKYNRIRGLVNARMKTAEGSPLPKNPYSCYNDWLNPTGQNLSPEFFSHCWYLNMLNVASKIAEVVGDNENRDLWNDAFKIGKEYFNELYYDRASGEYSERIQSSAVLPLAFGLVPEGEGQRVADTLHRYLKENSFKLTTGFQASRFLLDVLTDYGYGEDAVRLLHQDEFPSWKYILDTGATNITESWFGMNDPDRSISMCHFSLGGAFSWLFEYLGGIRVYQCSPGFEKIVIEPHCFKSLGACRVNYRSKQGIICVEWRFVDGKLEWSCELPDGVQADVREPHIYS